MSWVATAITVLGVGTQMYRQDKAEKKAEKQAEKDREAALAAERFADTEGEGLGQLGQISLEVDENLDEKDVRSGKTSALQI